MVCEKTSLLVDETAQPEYFDDEELDEFRGRNAGAYDDAETDRFREVLLTLPHDEVLAWTAALEKRGIALPAALRDEVLILLS